jgi:hypothetical protein
MRAITLTIALCLTAASVAHGDDSKTTGDTLASPWSGGALQLSEQDKRFVLAVSTLFEPGIRIRAEASAPLDDATRTAVFVSKTGLAPAFRTALFIGYDSMWNALALPGPVSLNALCGKPEGCTASELELARKAAEKAKQQANEQKQREGQPPSSGQLTWSAGLDLAFAYDRKTAFLDDIADDTQTKEFSSSDFQLGGSLLFHVADTAFMARGGYERTHAVQLGTFQRCTVLHSTVQTVVGQDCSEQHYLQGDPGVAHSGYLRLSGAYYPSDNLLARYLSATELRLNFENLTTDAASFDIHVLIFARGLQLGGQSLRTGIGTRVRVALASPVMASYGRGDLYDYSLFGIIGTSF